MKKLIFILLTFGVLLLVGCPTETEEDIPLNVENINYNSAHSECVMDLYRSEKTTRPVVMLIHGGAWITIPEMTIILSGSETHIPALDASMGLDRAHMVKFKDLFLNNGYHVINIDYRRINIIQPDGTNYKDMLDDIKNAITFLKNNAVKYKIDTSKIVMYGYSAGAHLAELYSYKVTDSPIPVKLCVGRAGPADFTNEDFRKSDLGGFANFNGAAILLNLNPSASKTEIANAFRIRLMTNLLGITTDETNDLDKIIAANQDKVIDVSPIHHVKSTSPRTILLHGKQDTLVPYSIAVFLDEKLTECGVLHDFITLPNSGHDLDKDPTETADFNNKVLSAIKEI